MNSQFENHDNRAFDMFRSIREMKSPLSMNAVKNYILAHIEEMTIWQKIQRFVLQTGTFTVMIATICCINSPAGEGKRGIVIRSGNTLHSEASQANYGKQIVRQGSPSGAVEKNLAGNLTIDRKISNVPIENNSIIPYAENVPQMTLIPVLKEEPAVILSNLKPAELSDLIRSTANQSAPIHPFAEVQGMAYSGRIGMLGEGFGIGVTHDWQIMSLHLMNANGIHDDRKDAPSLTNIGIKKENEQQVALLFGGIIEKGRLYSSIQIGPSYNMSQVTSGIKDVPTSNTIESQRFFGMSSQISFGYRITDYLSANIEGLLNYHSAISGGMMISFMIQQ